MFFENDTDFLFKMKSEKLKWNSSFQAGRHKL